MLRKSDIHSRLAAKKMSAEAVVKRMLSDRQVLLEVFEGLSAEKPRIRFGCSKALLLLSARRPEVLYPHASRFLDLLDSKNQILKWTAIAVLGNMSEVDQGRRLNRLLPRFYALLSSGELITANSAIAALGKIAFICPDKRNEIADELMKVGQHQYATDECRNIALGKVVLSLASCVDRDQPDQKIVQFVSRQTGNSRPATAKKAKLFLKRLTAA